MNQDPPLYEQLAIDMPAQEKRSPLGEPCPTCGAPVGETCERRTDHNPVHYIHAARRRLAHFLPVEER